MFVKDNEPLIMGILNTTPDSFSDGGKYVDYDSALKKVDEMLRDGADIIDVGGESTRPGADEVDEAEETNRVIPVVEAIRKKNKDIKISVDTTKYNVAKLAIDAGADIINDISGLNNDARLATLAAEYDKWLVIMHMKGKPRTMQQNPQYENPVREIFEELKYKIEFAKSKGLKKIIADVGIGFGKSYEHNIELLKNHSEFSKLGVPMLLGISRKSFIEKMLGIKNPEKRDFPTLLIHTLLISQNIDIIRVHDVKPYVLLKKIFNQLKKN
jgi:dihydropteroate synthase